MSDPSSSRGPISAWWALLLLPMAALAGWWVGAMPVSDPTPAPLAVPVQDDNRPTVDVAPASDEPSAWTSFDAAMNESRRTGKPVLIDFNAEWCGPCRRLKDEVFDDGTHGRAVQVTVIPVSIVDRAREEGRNPPEVQALQERYNIDAFPTLVVISARSGRTVQTRGYAGPQATVDWITQAAKSVR